MQEIVAAILIFAVLLVAGLGSLAIHPRFRDTYRNEDTHAIIRLAANLFVVLTSLVVGFMINSSRSTFDSVDHNIHQISTSFILLDRTLRHLGADTVAARDLLVAYVEHVLDSPGPVDPEVTDKTSENLLAAAGEQIRRLAGSPDPVRAVVFDDALSRYRQIVEMRWTLAEQSEGSIPTPLILLVLAWLFLIFASFGYRAPRNVVVVITLGLSAALVTFALYIVIDMKTPFEGPIQVSLDPLRRALTEMRQ